MRTRLGLLAVAAGLLAAVPGPAQPRTPPPPVAKTGFENLSFPDEGEARDARLRFEAVQDYLKERKGDAVPWDRVCDTAQFLLDAKSDYFYEPKGGPADPDGRKRYVSIKDQTNRIVGAFPKEGRQFYQVTFGPTAAALLKDAAADGYDKAKLADVSQRYFHTAAGGQATLLLATLNLETGRYPEAAYGFDRLLDRPDSDDLLTPRTLLKAAVAFKRAGDPRHAEASTSTWDRLEKKFPRDGLAVGRRTYALEDLRAEFARPVELMFGGPGDDVVAMRYGNPSHTGAGSGGTPFLDPAFGPTPMLRRRPDSVNEKGEPDTQAAATKHAMEWVRTQVAAAYDTLNGSKGQVAVPGFFPVTAPNLVLFRNYDEVCAVVTREGFVHDGTTYRAGQLFWATVTTAGGAVSLMEANVGTDQQIPKLWWQQWQTQHKMPTLIFDNPQAGSLSHDGKLVYVVDDLAVPPPPQVHNNPNFGGFGLPGGAGGPPGGLLNGAAEASKLLAFDLANGALRWQLGGPGGAARPDDPDRTNGAAKLLQDALFLGPPLPVNGLIYVMFEKEQQLQLACLNPHKAAGPADGRLPLLAPELLWSQKLGSPNLRLGQDPLRRVQPAYLAYADGVLVCPTNCGAVVAVDVNARSLLWARGYSTPPAQVAVYEGMPGGFRGRGGFRGEYAVPQPLSSDRWRAAAPIVAGGKVVVAAHDANQLQCLDLRTGNLLWADDRRGDDLYVGGVVGDKVLVVGKTAVRAYDLAGGPGGKAKLAWPGLKVATPCGHGAATRDGLYYLPMVGDPDRKDLRDPQVWAIDAATGAVRTKTAFRRDDLGVDPTYGPDALRRQLALGNLLFHEGLMISQSASQVSAFPLIDLKRREMDRLLARNPKDPTGLADRGELLLDAGKVAEAVADFREAERNDPPDAVRRRLRAKKHQAFTELLRADFPAGEPYLAEYEALCEVPIDTDEPNERKRLLDEQVRRKGVYLSLLARGREKQGRLADAFRAYRAFAALGDSRELASIPDEPHGTTRPDVWARGRIEAMVRATADPAARKPLAELVAAEWEAVRSANDLGRLKEFVGAFGPSFPEGRAAQLLLADKLLGTNNDDDARAAELLLLQLKATADDRPTQARAVEALARLMTRRGLLDDAVGLYAQLGSAFADVPARADGATGAAVFAGVVTDRRLLSHLEPGRAGFPGRYKFVPNHSPAPTPRGVQAFTLTPDGDLFPFFHRNRLTMEVHPNGGSWVLKVADRVTGEVRGEFKDLAPGPTTGFGSGPGGPAYRLAQASGHTLLLTVGQWAYCFDLSAPGPDGKLGRRLWEYDLFKRTPLPQNAQPQAQADPRNPDELVVNYEDGWTLRVGRSAVLQPNYVCLITRDGLAAVDPATGQDLWQRSNVSPKARVFGDARHVFLVEETGAGFKSRVLRAADGSSVEGVKDFSDAFTSPARVAVLGRHLLLAEGKAAWGLRLLDPLSGADVWSKGYPDGSTLLKTLDPELTGCLLADGTFEVLAARTGEVVFRGGLDKDRVAAHLGDPADPKRGRVSPLLVADAERLYLFLNRPADGTGVVHPWIRSVPVNGVAYGFDRATAKRLWFNEGLFLKQVLLVERFDELPALIAAGTAADEGRVMAYRVAALDKQSGKVVYNKPDAANSPNSFVSMWTPDPKSPRVVELWRNDYRLRIAPADDDGRVTRNDQ